MTAEELVPSDQSHNRRLTEVDKRPKKSVEADNEAAYFSKSFAFFQLDWRSRPTWIRCPDSR